MRCTKRRGNGDDVSPARSVRLWGVGEDGGKPRSAQDVIVGALESEVIWKPSWAVHEEVAQGWFNLWIPMSLSLDRRMRRSASRSLSAPLLLCSLQSKKHRCWQTGTGS
ncbi:MAG: hypothetical protein F4X05_11595 [Rhodothermaceae bacterium]|nr:hypothetical protein [Rhodothermaceae bacterium]